MATVLPLPSAPLTPDLLVARLDMLRIEHGRSADRERRSDLGQFLTPPATANLMASMVRAPGRELRILDPGAGLGALSAALVASLCRRENPPRSVELVVYEIDRSVRPSLEQTLADCDEICRQRGIRFAVELRDTDFVGEAASILRGGLFATDSQPFDVAILNPPYRKIATDSRERKLLSQVGIEASNLYSAFLALSVGLLRAGGEFVAITPRSFCNGPYFREFRASLLRQVRLQRVHSFEARNLAFSDDDVLQENVIVHARKTEERSEKVVVSTSLGPDDLLPSWHEVEQERVVSPHDPDLVIHLPADRISDAMLDRLTHLTCTLDQLGLGVSTGPVVDFRSDKWLRETPDASCAPLIYPAHFNNGSVVWPDLGGRKPNGLVRNRHTESLLVENGPYVLIKRFTSKEEPQRIVAALCDPLLIPGDRLAFENHLNYIHANGRPLPRNLARGLVVFLNSTLLDNAFREWSGHTQVNASDLRRMRYPSRGQLEMLGSRATALADIDQNDALLASEVWQTAQNGVIDPVKGIKRKKEALAVLKALGLPREQQNDRSALTLLGLLGMKPRSDWADAAAPLCGITQLMDFFAKEYGKTYAPNSRETVRRFTVHQFVQAGIAIQNPDKPDRATNSPKAVYQIEPAALNLLRQFSTPDWDAALRAYLSSSKTLQQKYAAERQTNRIPLLLPGGSITLSAGGQNELVRKIIDNFCPQFTPGATPLYVGDTAQKFAYIDEPALAKYGYGVDRHGKMPDVVVSHSEKGWLVLIEAVTSHGPINPKRQEELKQLFPLAAGSTVFVTAFLTRRDMVRYTADIAWETEVWVAESPTHLIHFNGERFLGPY